MPEFRLLSTPDAAALGRFLERLIASGAALRFHPHPMTREHAEVLATRPTKDLYVLAMEDGEVRAYGMLRGWDEGFSIPSLGIAVAPDAQGQGLGNAMMRELHRLAHLQGAKRIRLKVYPDNQVAIRLYQRLGYRFEGEENGQLVGYCDLTTAEN